MTLKPCPFCGGEAVGPTDAWPHIINCCGCGAEVKGFTFAEEGELEATEKWNRRAIETYGQWERVGSDGIVCCSVCGIPLNKTRICWPDSGSGYYYIATNYCSHCGAKMEKGDCDA